MKRLVFILAAQLTFSLSICKVEAKEVVAKTERKQKYDVAAYRILHMHTMTPG